MLKPWLSIALLLVVVALLSRLPRDDSGMMFATDQPKGALHRENDDSIDDMENDAVIASDKVLTNILSVDVNVSETDPPRISLDVYGEHPDGCEYPVRVEQSRDGSTVSIEVFRNVPADVFCPMILKPYQGAILLEGSFESGAYTIKVNSHTQSVNL